MITYVLSRTVSKLLQIIGQIFVYDTGVPLFNTLAEGKPLNSRLRNSATRSIEKSF